MGKRMLKRTGDKRTDDYTEYDLGEEMEETVIVAAGSNDISNC